METRSEWPGGLGRSLRWSLPAEGRKTRRITSVFEQGKLLIPPTPLDLPDPCDLQLSCNLIANELQ